MSMRLVIPVVIVIIVISTQYVAIVDVLIQVFMMCQKLPVNIIPTITNVAACIKALTGIGPSIASGNHTCNPN